MIVAIDGPAGSGKSTTACLVAEALGCYHLDSGMMYRGMALALIREPRIRSAAQIAAFLAQEPLSARFQSGALCLSLHNEDVNDQLRGPGVSAKASAIATLEPVRTAMVALQRALGAQYGQVPGLVVEGRDIGTVVFPDAAVKVFLTASIDTRARRRHEQLKAAGRAVGLAEVRQSIILRDRQDAERRLSPLRQAEDALVVETDDCSVQEQVQKVVARVREQTR